MQPSQGARRNARYEYRREFRNVVRDFTKSSTSQDFRTYCSMRGMDLHPMFEEMYEGWASGELTGTT